MLRGYSARSVVAVRVRAIQVAGPRAPLAVARKMTAWITVTTAPAYMTRAAYRTEPGTGGRWMPAAGCLRGSGI
jgi:hypothetical protein